MRWKQEYVLSFRSHDPKQVLKAWGFVFKNRTPTSQYLFQYRPWENAKGIHLPEGLLFYENGSNRRDAHLLWNETMSYLDEKHSTKNKGYELVSDLDWRIYDDVEPQRLRKSYIFEDLYRHYIMDIYKTKIDAIMFPTLSRWKYIRRTKDHHKIHDGFVIKPDHEFVKNLKHIYPVKAMRRKFWYDIDWVENLTRKNLKGLRLFEQLYRVFNITNKSLDGWFIYDILVQTLKAPDVAMILNKISELALPVPMIATIIDSLQKNTIIAKKVPLLSQVVEREFAIAKLKAKGAQFTDLEGGIAKLSPKMSQIIKHINSNAKFKPAKALMLKADYGKYELVPLPAHIMKKSQETVYATQKFLDAKVYYDTLINSKLVPIDSRIIKEDFIKSKKIRIKAVHTKSEISATKQRLKSKIEDGLKFMQKKYLPAKVEGGLKKAQWEFESIVDLFDRQDLLDIPNTDYKYEDGKPQVHDENGRPYFPIGSINEPEVEVKTAAITHPFPEWQDVMQHEIWVHLHIYQDVVFALYKFWKENSFKLGGMKAQRGLTFLLKEVRNWIKEYTKDDPEYLRVFRMVRWYAEPLALNLQRTILVRYYDHWTDNLNKGQIDGAMSGFTITPQGALENNNSTSVYEFTRDSLIDGEFQFSYLFRNLTGGASLKCWVDGNLEIDVNSSQLQRVSIPVVEGNHTYRIEFSGGGLGDSVKLSGFKVTNCEFLYAETRYEEELKSKTHHCIHQLVEQLVGYYSQHWGKEKDKGAMPIKQRKIWIED